MTPDPDLLDDPGALADGDPSGFLRVLATAGAQVREAVALAADAGVRVLRRDGRPRVVVTTGSGTPAAAGAVLAAVAGATSPVPVVAVAAGAVALPGWVSAVDLVVAVSGSGRAPEALAALEDAGRRGARVLAVGAEDSPLRDRCERARGVFVPVPARAPERASLWSLTLPLLVAGDALGLLALPPAAVEAAALRLEQTAVACRPDAETFTNPAKTLAVDLAGGLPVVWGCSPLAGTAAERAAAQWAATAGSACLAGVLPGALTEAVGVLDGPQGALRSTGVAGLVGDDGGEPGDLDLFRDRGDDDAGWPLRVVLLRDPAEEETSVAATADALVVLARSHGLEVTQLRAQGASRLERLASLVGLLDAAAAYAALLAGVDPATGPADSRGAG